MSAPPGPRAVRRPHRSLAGLAAVLTFVLASLGLVASAQEQEQVHRVPPTIDPTGTQDVTSSLQRFIDDVPDGSVIEFQRDARYRVEGTLELRRRRDLVLRGNGATVFATSRGESGRAHIRILSSDDIEVHDLIVRGANPHAGTGDRAYVVALENQHGFQLSGVQGVVLAGVTVTDVYGDFVYLGAADATGWSRNVVVRDSTFERNGRQGIGVTAARDVVIRNNRIAEIRRATVDIEPHHADGGVRRFQFLHNDIGNGRLHFFNIVGHRAAALEDIVVRGNSLSGQQLEIHVNPPDGVRPQRLAFEDNSTTATFGSSRTSPIRIRNSDTVVIRGNHQPLSEREEVTAVMLRGSCAVTIEDNEFPGAAQLVDSDDPACGASPPTAPDAQAPPASSGEDGPPAAGDDGSDGVAAGGRPPVDPPPGASSGDQPSGESPTSGSAPSSDDDPSAPGAPPATGAAPGFEAGPSPDLEPGNGSSELAAGAATTRAARGAPASSPPEAAGGGSDGDPPVAGSAAMTARNVATSMLVLASLLHVLALSRDPGRRADGVTPGVDR